MVKNAPTVQEMQVQSLGRIYSSTFAWEIQWSEEPGELQSIGLQRVGHTCATEHTCICLG